MRPSLIALSALVLAALLIGACGGDDEATGTTPVEDEETTPATTSEEQPGQLELSVEQFDDGAEIPVENTCDGTGDAPLPEISGAPDDTAELALLVVDIDAGGGFLHWGVTGIEPSIASFGPIGAPAGAEESTNDFGEIGYGGPCPPEGDGPHRYLFTVHALAEPVELPGGADAKTTIDAVEGASIAAATVTGSYER